VGEANVAAMWSEQWQDSGGSQCGSHVV